MRRAIFHMCKSLSSPLVWSSLERKTFISKLIESVNEEMKHNKDLQENKRKLQEELSNLNQSEALQKARSKFQTVEHETVKSSEKLKKSVQDLKEHMEKLIEEAKKTDYGKKAAEICGHAMKTTKEAAKTLEKSADSIGHSDTFRQISSTMRTIQLEIDQVTLGGYQFYQSPERLKLRSELEASAKAVEPNTEATGVAVSEDTKWFQSWRKMTENNPYFDKLLEWKIKFDESENPLARMTRAVTDKVHDLSGAGDQTGFTAVLSELHKLDPEFDKFAFVDYCRLEVIPNVLEAMVRGELDILADWCHERAYKQVEFPIKQAKTQGLSYNSRIMHVDKVELLSGSMMEQGPVLIINFVADQIEAVVDRTGKVVQGDIDQPQRVIHVWALVRDVEQLDPRLAWKVMEIHAQAQKLLF